MKKILFFVSVFPFLISLFLCSCSFKGGDISDLQEQLEQFEYVEYQDDFDQEERSDQTEEKISEIVIATYNTELFFDIVCDSGYCSKNDFEKQLTVKEYSKKIKDIADAIKLIDADIVLLQEVEKQSCLDDLIEELDFLYTDSYLAQKGGPGSINTAVITKGQILLTKKHLDPIPLPQGGTTSFTRAFLEAEINYGNRNIIVFSAHFKSKFNDDPDRRLAEAEAALKIIMESASINGDTHLVVLGGDLNDTPGSPPIDTLEKSPMLLRVASELPEEDQATYWYDGPIAIDHLFHIQNGRGSYKKGSAEVIRDHGAYTLISSDHAALKATFIF